MESNKERIDVATDMLRLVPLPAFTVVDAMVLAGIAKDVANTPTFKRKIQVVLTSFEQQFGKPIFENTPDGKVERSINLLKMLPKGNKEKVADIVRLVGCGIEDTKAGAVHQKLQRRINKWKLESQQQEDPQQQSRQVQRNIPRVQDTPPILNVQASRASTGSQKLTICL